jgi:helicase SWR1
VRIGSYSIGLFYFSPFDIFSRAHRIGQIRDVHIYRFISQHTVEEAIFRKANQKRSLDDIVIQKGEFDWRAVFTGTEVENEGLSLGLSKALGEFEEAEDAQAAALAAAEEALVVGEDRNDFEEGASRVTQNTRAGGHSRTGSPPTGRASSVVEESRYPGTVPEEGEEGFVEGDGEGEMGDGGVADYMLKFVETDWEFFSTWKV